MRARDPAPGNSPVSTVEHDKTAPFEWPTLVMLALCYALWIGATFWAAALWLPLGIVLAGLAIALHSSLQHEALHGHPFARPGLNAALVFPALGLFVPYGRYRATHLAHHQDARLTDPYDDPESHYLDPAVWSGLPQPLRWLLRLNNTLAGRLVLGPWIALAGFFRRELAMFRHGPRDAARQAAAAWAWHLPAVGVAGLLVAWSAMPWAGWLAAVWLGLSLLSLRGFAEHRAHHRASSRSVVIEDRGPLALLFLNNNLHAVHHKHPRLPWYRLPDVYRRNRNHFLRRNGGYSFPGYGTLLRQYLWQMKEPVAHPLWPQATPTPADRPGRAHRA